MNKHWYIELQAIHRIDGKETRSMSTNMKTLYTEIKKLPYFDLRIGVMFYFYDNPIECKKEIKEVFRMYCNITKLPFVFYRYDMDENLKMKMIKGGYVQFFNRFIDRNNFNLSKYIILTDATAEKLQNVKCEMMLSNYESSYALRLPNRMYFEFLPPVCYDDLLNFIRSSCKIMKIHYCCCNPLLGVNDYCLTKSSSYAINQIKKQICLSDKYSVFDNPTLLKDLETKIDGANAIQVFSSTLYSLIGQENLICQCRNYNLYCEVENDYMITAVSKEKIPEYDEEFLTSYIALNNVMKDIISYMKKPLMFWKENEWNVWKERLV